MFNHKQKGDTPYGSPKRTRDRTCPKLCVDGFTSLALKGIAHWLCNRVRSAGHHNPTIETAGRWQNRLCLILVPVEPLDTEAVIKQEALGLPWFLEQLGKGNLV